MTLYRNDIVKHRDGRQGIVSVVHAGTVTVHFTSNNTVVTVYAKDLTLVRSGE